MTSMAGTAPLSSSSCAIAVPLRAVDNVQVEAREGAWTVRATKHVDADDRYMVGHFPGRTIYPGVFILESLCQAIRNGIGIDAAHWQLVAVHSLRLRKPLLAGDVMELSAEVTINEAGVVSARAHCLGAGAAIVASMLVEFGAERQHV